MDDALPAPQFADIRQQEDVARLGMWVFLSTEVLFFGGMMLLYFAYRSTYPAGFAAAARHTDILIGTINTAILLTSSFAVAWAVAAAKDGDRRLAAVLLGAGALLGMGFLGLKSIEYLKEYHEHLVPAVNFAFPGKEANSVELFFIFYFISTGLHAVHLTIGIVALIIMALRSARGQVTPHLRNAVSVTGLYWHFVDAVWLFLFALIYLPGRGGA